MKIRGVIISTIMAVVIMTSCAMANETEPAEVSSAAPVMVPYLNKSIEEVTQYEITKTRTERVERSGGPVSDVVDEHTTAAGQNRKENRQAYNASNDKPGSMLTNTGRMEIRESEAEQNAACETDPGSGISDGSDPVLTYLGEWTITAYCPCSTCCGAWATGCTASGEPATAGHTVACNILPFYTHVMIDDVVYTVEDTGSTEYGDAWIDVFFNTHEEALAFGVQTKSVYLVN